jgi:hypothetical protein
MNMKYNYSEDLDNLTISQNAELKT